jgi:hypothetical protein
MDCYEERYIRCIRIDSIENETNSQILYNFPELYGNQYDCMKSYSWIGKKIINSANFNSIINVNNDTIKFKTDAKLNESWDLYNFSNGNKIVANISKIDTMSFVGKIDTVKIINLQFYDSLNIQQPNFINNIEFIMSKNYGLIKTINFIDFPFSDEYYKIVFELSGLPDGTGISNKSTFGDIYNYEIGDEFHSKSSSVYSNFTVSYNNSVSIITDKKFSNDLDTVKYLYDNYYWGSYFVDFETGYQDFFTHSTSWYSYTDLNKLIISDFLDSSIINSLPMELVLNNGLDYYTNNNYLMFVNSCGLLTYRNLGQEYSPSIQYNIDTCITYPYFDSWEGEYTNYIVGAKIFNFQLSIEMSTSGYFSHFQYLKKGNKTCGSELKIPLNSEIINQNSDFINISPNPTTNTSQIKLDKIYKNINLDVYNIQGQIIRNESFENTKTIVFNRNNLNSGIYFLKLKTENWNKTQKLIIE